MKWWPKVIEKKPPPRVSHEDAKRLRGKLQDLINDLHGCLGITRAELSHLLALGDRVTRARSHDSMLCLAEHLAEMQETLRHIRSAAKAYNPPPKD